MYSLGKDWRNKHNNNMFDPRQYNMENYYTDVHQKKEMKHSFGEELLSNLHLLPDPLKKNLADSIITSEEMKQSCKDKKFLNKVIDPEPPKMETNTDHNHTPFGGISSFFSGVFSVISGAMSHLRPKSPVQYFDCFDDVVQGPPLSWHSANSEVQNKSAREIHLKSKSEMNVDCKTAAAQCEDKLNKVRLLLTTKPIETPKFRPRRPRKAFVEAGSVEESFEDAFAPEDFVRIANNTFIEYYSPFQIQNEEMLQTESPKIKTEKNIHENTDIVKTLPEVPVKCEEVDKDSENKMVKDIENKTVVNDKIEVKEEEKSSRQELITSCEDKLSKLKALLQEKRKKNTISKPSPDSSPESVTVSNEKHTKPPKSDKVKDKRYKNHCRTTDKRKKTKMRKSIQDDLVFAQEINCDDLSSVENSPSVTSLDRLSDTVNPFDKVVDKSSSSAEYFDEVSGRFRSTSTTESEDSFQIVFNDSPKETRMRHVSDCESEDSFIVFEDSPDSCYTSNDVFGDSEESDNEYTDSESELSDTDDIQVTKLSHTLSRTLSDLTDGSLYEDKSLDEVDCAVRSVCDEIPSEDVTDLCDNVTVTEVEPKSTGLLLNEERKLQKRNLPPKSVHFSTDPPKVHVMRVWAFAARQARAGHWERYVLDRDRFKRRIADVDMAVSWVLKPQHRKRVMFQRFMPWWNAQRRKELAEKKEREARIKEEQKAEEERLKQEEERLKQEEERLKQESLLNGNVESTDIVNDTDEKQNNDTNDVTVNDTSPITNDGITKVVTDNDTSPIVNEDSAKVVTTKDTGPIVNDDSAKVVTTNDTSPVINDGAVKVVTNNDKLKNRKCNGFVKNEVIKKSSLNHDSANVKINVNNKQNDFTSKLRSETVSST